MCAFNVNNIYYYFCIPRIYINKINNKYYLYYMYHTHIHLYIRTYIYIYTHKYICIYAMNAHIREYTALRDGCDTCLPPPW